MKRVYSLMLLMGSLSLFAASEYDFSNLPVQPHEIVIHNRVLLKVNGKSISLMDVVKKMDLLFYRQFPELSSNLMARYQFYTINWRHILSSVIDDHLILADAAEKKVEVTEGDIREMMVDLFGPDVVINLDKLNLTYDEASELIKTELIVRQMMQVMVRSKAVSEAYPKEVRRLYEKAVHENPATKKWVYEMVTIESKDETKAASAATKALALLNEQKVKVGDLAAMIEEEGVTVRASEEIERNEKELSATHKAILATLSVGSYSSPLTQNKGDSVLKRIFHLKENEEGKVATFVELENKLSQELIKQASEKHGTAYSEKLRAHYGITAEYLEKRIPEHYQPFSIR